VGRRRKLHPGKVISNCRTENKNKPNKYINNLLRNKIIQALGTEE
jgi:hypothetical protein